MDDAILLPPDTDEHREMKEIVQLRVYAGAKRIEGPKLKSAK
jgi:hypothetical protein